MKLINLTNKTFGNLTIIERDWDYQKEHIIFHYAAHPKIFETFHGKHAIKYYTKELKNYEEKS